MLHGYVDGIEAPFAGTGGMGLPDWNKAVGLNHGTSIIQADGWLLYCTSINVTTESNLFVNEQRITHVYASNGYRSEDSIMIPVTKGDVVKSTGKKPIVFNFYPLK